MSDYGITPLALRIANSLPPYERALYIAQMQCETVFAGKLHSFWIYERARQILRGQNERR